MLHNIHGLLHRYNRFFRASTITSKENGLTYINNQGSTGLPYILDICQYNLYKAYEYILNTAENKLKEYENKIKQTYNKIRHNYTTSVKLEELRDKTVYVKAENIYTRNR